MEGQETIAKGVLAYATVTAAVFGSLIIGSEVLVWVVESVDAYTAKQAGVVGYGLGFVFTIFGFWIADRIEKRYVFLSEYAERLDVWSETQEYPLEPEAKND